MYLEWNGMSHRLVLCLGVCAARLHDSSQGIHTRLLTLGSAFFFPGTLFSVFFCLNLVLRVSGSTGAVPFTALLVLLLIWLGISVLLNERGAHIGYRQVQYEYPVRNNQIPGEIPAKLFRAASCRSQSFSSN